MDETKVRATVEMKPSRNSKEAYKFLGMSQWYAKFIKKYGYLCEPLYNIKRKLKKFCWSIEAQKAFDAVKAAKIKVPILKLPDSKKPFELLTDASSIGAGAVLNQKQRPGVFASRTLCRADGNYTATERECLAVVWAMNKFRTCLGSLPITVITDFAALTRLTHGKNLSSRIIRRGVKVDRPTNEKRKQQGGPVRARGIQEHQYSPYIEQQSKSSSRNTRNRSGQQQNYQERKGGANNNSCISLEVLVGDINYKS
ncbi:retrovirus-related Pol polyprotein from transposon 297 [Trichonephila clavipes]|nr:retrovirus-related Pol polyprotein from transposon 297 [Trichonephila clavipes]